MKKVDFLSKLKRRNEEDGEGTLWLETFLELCYEGWYWKKAVFIAWSATPKKSRWPRTLQDLADLLEYSSLSTFYNWKKRTPEISDRIQQVIEDGLSEFRSDVYQALIDVSSRPTATAHSDRKLYLEMIGDYTRKPIEVNWRQEAEAAGLNANQIFQQVVLQFAAVAPASLGPDDPRSLEISTEADQSSSD